MFELNFPAYLETLETVKKLEDTIKTEMDNHLKSVMNLSQSWYGNVAEIQLNRMKLSIAGGS